MMQNWRRFVFFDRDLLQDSEKPGEPYLGLQELNVVCSSSGNGRLYIGEASGSVYVVDKTWAFPTIFKAYTSQLAHLVYVRQQNVLVTIGNDEPGVNPLLKVWLLDKMDKQGKPFCSRIAKTSPNNRPVRVSALAVHSTLQYAAVGFEDSSILLYKGDVTKERYNNRVQLLRDGLTAAADGAITGVAFHGSSRHLTLFVTTQQLVLAYTIVGSSKEQETKLTSVLDKHGCGAKCWALADAELDTQFIIARSDAVYCYQPPDLRSQCYVFEGEKLLIRTAGCYLAVVCRDVGTASLGEGSKKNMITIYDLPNSFIAYSAPIDEVIDVFHEWGSFFVFTKTWKIYQLREKDTKAKLDILYRKNLYDIAINVAKRQNYDEDRLTEIYKQYGDYLYQKNDFDNAVKQYIRTIGTLEASYVIRKLLDAQRVPQLTLYLESLHRLQAANEDHTTILLNCYTKLNDTTKLQHFVKSSAREVFFDVETAIRVLRASNYTDDALFLAQLHKKHDSALHILVEDKRRYQEAVQYIRELESRNAEDAMKRYGKILIGQVPDECTALLKRLCCVGFKQSVEPSDEQFMVPVGAVNDATRFRGAMEQTSELRKAPADQFIHIFVNDAARLGEFLEHMISTSTDCQPVMYNTLLELYLREHSAEKEAAAKRKCQEKIVKFLETSEEKYDLDHALILCQTYNFSPGMLYIYEKANLLPQIVQHHIDSHDFKKVIDACKKYGADAANRDIWLEALWFFARSDDCPTACVAELLQSIDELRILPPLMVLEILSHSPTVTLAVVKDYLLRWIRGENAQIERAEIEIAQWKDEIDKAEELIDNLKTTGQVFQASKCSACDIALELPTVHFLCKHSFHQHCFESYNESENECPKCAPLNKELKAKIIALAVNKDPYPQFKADLQASSDTIGTIADYFSRGLFHHTSSTPKFQEAPSPIAPPPVAPTVPALKLTPATPAAKPPQLQSPTGKMPPARLPSPSSTTAMSIPPRAMAPVTAAGSMPSRLQPTQTRPIRPAAVAAPASVRAMPVAPARPQPGAIPARQQQGASLNPFEEDDAPNPFDEDE